MVSAFRCLGLLLALSVVACDAEGEAPTSVEQDDTEEGRLQLVVTVDWEGRDLLEENLAAMEGLRERFPEVRLVQFLNAAYFTKPDALDTEVRARIARALLPDDELGLHVHGWKSLFEASGVAFRATPTFWDAAGVVTDCTSDCGHEVPISEYDAVELRAVLRFSSDTLEAQGFGRPTSFRAGGWMADDSVREALVDEGFTTENSAVPPAFLASEIGHLPLQGWVEALWSETTSTSQPFRMDVGESGQLLEIPDNGALADYMRADEMVSVYEACKARWEEDPRHDVVVSIGFHQETAARFLPRLEDALEQMLDDARTNDVPLRSTTAGDLARDP